MLTDTRFQASRQGHETEEYSLVMRHLRPDDYDAVCDLMTRAYPGLNWRWKREEYVAQVNRFPDGQIAIEDGGRLVAAAFALVVDYANYGDQHTYHQITGNGRFTTHDPDGDVLYGADIFVDPEYRGLRLGRRLYEARKNLCRALNLRAIVAGGRIPGYREHADRMSPEEYIELVKRKELHDPVLSFQLANDFTARRIIKGYLPSDHESLGYASVLEWNNIHYKARETPLLEKRKSTVRIGAVQWMMRPTRDVDELMQQVEFFVDALGGYTADFAVLPEYFNAPLLARYNDLKPPEAMRKLAEHAPEICDRMQDLAIKYNINIVGGSLPHYDESGLYNVAWLFRRDGSRDSQYKLHVTPDESKWWGTRGGAELKALETDVGRIGILVCYDVEFPELPRLLAEQGVRLLFVPYWVDTKNGYLRVQRCAQARAIENECYVTITGSVGNLPRVENAEIQYSQSAIFTPADFAFPHDGVAAASTPNTEMTLICDLDLNKLRELRAAGSVRNFQDRRRDLYRVEWLGGRR